MQREMCSSWMMRLKMCLMKILLTVEAMEVSKDVALNEFGPHLYVCA